MQNLFLCWLHFRFFYGASGSYTDEQIAFWEDEAFPVLEENCWKCHGVSKKIRGGLILTTLEGVLKRRRVWTSVDLKILKTAFFLK
jgi:hypothetical protein